MTKYTLSIDGMACNMCEAHINEAIRNHFKVKKVTSSYKKKETIILSEEEISEEKLQEVINATGYTFVSMQKEPYVKKGFFF